MNILLNYCRAVIDEFFTTSDRFVVATLKLKLCQVMRNLEMKQYCILSGETEKPDMSSGVCGIGFKSVKCAQLT